MAVLKIVTRGKKRGQKKTVVIPVRNLIKRCLPVILQENRGSKNSNTTGKTVVQQKKRGHSCENFYL